MLREYDRDFVRQHQALKIAISRSRIEYDLRVNPKNGALLNLFEQASLKVADMNDARGKVNNGEFGIDRNYSLSTRDFANDPLVFKWMRNRE